ncbi:MAG: SufD family Fe-S cluster assembly protein [Thermoproteota archaeon]|nr:SufD family Fe-S cluster assembly protein [Thermoproteota archaeon]
MISLSLITKDNFNKILSDKYNEPDWIAETRKEAITRLSDLPAEVSPLYSKYTGLGLLKPEKVFFSNVESSNLSEDLESRLNEIKSSPSLLMIGSSVLHAFVPEYLSKQGLIVSSIQDAFNNYPDLLKKYLKDNSLNYGEDRFLALGISAFQSGFFVYVPKNLVLEEPIRIVYSLKADGISSICRNIVISDTGSKATIVQELYSSVLKRVGGGVPVSAATTTASVDTNENANIDTPSHSTVSATNTENGSSELASGGDTSVVENNVQPCYFEVLECSVKPTAELEFITLQAMDSSTINVSNRKAFVEQDGKMSWYSGMFGTKLCRYKTDSVMKGPGASSEDVEIVFGSEKQSFDISSNLDHAGFSSRGKVLVKSIVKDGSKSLFKGMIKIRKNAKASESFLAGHAILLNKGSIADAIPGLEIETNEVKATHSASVSQIDEEQIFYLMCRGLDRESAKREIVNGFVEPLSRKMGPFIRAWISYLFENKWTGKPLVLKADEVMEQILEVEKSRYKETADIFEKHYKYR